MTQHQNHAPAIENIQRYLRRISYSEPTIPPPPVDGIFESVTEEALREYQRLRGIPVTGVADFYTWERLYADYRSSLAVNSPPRAMDIFPGHPLGYILKSGATDYAVTAVQYMLRELGYHYRELEDLGITGIYDDVTELAVRAFQARNGLLPTGNVDLLTWNAITNQYNTYFRRQPIE